MNTQMIDYKKVKCPKCGKAYFRVKDNSGFTTLSFIFKPDPIYKDGELQNPTEAEPITVRCECLECGCNFRVETHDIRGDYRFIDEDEERKENERKLAESFKVLKKETEKTKTELDIETPHQTGSCQLKINESSLTNAYVEPVFDKISKTWQDGLREELDEIKAWQGEFEKQLYEVKERLAELEEKK